MEEQRLPQATEVPEIPPVTPPEQPRKSISQLFSNKKILIPIGVVLLIIVVFAFTMGGNKSQPTTTTSSATQAPKAAVSPPKAKKMIGNVVNVKTNSGLSFQLAKTMTGRFYKNDSASLNAEFTDLASSDLSKTSQSQYMQLKLFTKMNNTNSKTITYEPSQTVNIGGVKLTKRTGKETFAKTPRSVDEYTWTNNGKSYSAQFFSPNLDAYTSTIQSFFQSVNSTTSMTKAKSSLFSHLMTAYAQESTPTSDTTTNPSFPSVTFKPLQAEAPEVTSTFSESDGTWKDKRAQGYVFSAFKGQRLTTIATENTGYSYIESDLYDEKGNLVKGDLDTRVEFKVPETGNYYLIVENSKNGTESYTMKLQDRDVSDVVIKVKRYSDGQEFFFPIEESLVEVPFNDFAFMLYTNKVYDPLTITPNIYALPGTIAQFHDKAFFPEDSNNNKVTTKSTLTDNNMLLVEPVDKTLPSGSQLVLNFSTGPTSGYTYRIFTQ